MSLILLIKNELFLANILKARVCLDSTWHSAMVNKVNKIIQTTPIYWAPSVVKTQNLIYIFPPLILHTYIHNLEVIHDERGVGFHQVLDVVGAEDASLVLEQSHDALGEDVLPDVGVHGRYGVVKEIDVFILDG